MWSASSDASIAPLPQLQTAPEACWTLHASADPLISCLELASALLMVPVVRRIVPG